jgi:hypothetical protein
VRVGDDDPARRVCHIGGCCRDETAHCAVAIAPPGVTGSAGAILDAAMLSTSAQPVMLARYLQSTRARYSSAVMADSYWDAGWSSLMPVVSCWCSRARCGRGVGPSVGHRCAGAAGGCDKRYCHCASAGTGMGECVEDGDGAPHPSLAGVAACAHRLAAVAAWGEDVDDSVAGCDCGVLIS